jgi:nucleotide-binding universal stress UspA family protein
MDIARILFATDFSPRASATVEATRTLAERFGAAVDVLHVIDPPANGELPWKAVGPDGKPVDRIHFLRRIADLNLDMIAADLRIGCVNVHCRCEEGSAWRVITQIAEREHYDLIVLSTHGRRGFDRLMGSVAEKVVQHASCPVLVVRSEPNA